MSGFAIAIAGGAALLLAGGALFLLEGPDDWFTPACNDAPAATLGAGSQGYAVRLTLHDNSSGGYVRTCMYAADGTKLYDQTFFIQGETASYWDLNLAARPEVWIVDPAGHDAYDLDALGWYLDAPECQNVVPEFFHGQTHRVIMADCIDPPPVRRAPGPAPVDPASASRQGFWPASDSGSAGGGAALAVGGGLLVVSAAIVRFREPLQWFFLGLFSRISGPKVLDQGTRSQIHQLVQADPGIHRADIARRLELGAGQTVHHLRLLVREGMLAMVSDLGGRYYFPRGRWAPDEMRRHALLRRAPFAAIHAAAKAQPGASLAELARAAGQSPPQASRVVKRMATRGLLRVERAGKTIRVYPSTPPST